MLKLICVSMVYSFYLAIIITTVKYYHYCKVLFSIESRYKDITWKLTPRRVLHTYVHPMYRVEYFGYEYFILPELENKVLMKHKRFRVFGIVRPYSECLIMYKNDIVYTIIVLNDKRYAEEVYESFCKVYSRILYINIIGGVLWTIYTML